jgi:hypothetical protein
MASGVGYFMIGTRNNGTLWAGQVTSGFPPTFTANKIGTDTDWASVADDGAASDEMTKTNGTLWTLTFGSGTVTQVGTATNWVSVTSGGSHSLAIATP